MLNQTILVGRIARDLEIKKLEDGNKVSYITLAVQRAYKNVNGEYDTDFVPITLYNGVAESVKEYCKKGDVVGIKGRIQMFPKVGKDDFQEGIEIGIIADKVTFLSSARKDEE